MKTLLVAAAVLASWLAIPARAHAASTDSDDAASALVDQAASAYDQNQLDEALRLLARAYEMSPRPSILFNQAQVFRAKDDCAGALDAYQRFIATTTPNDPNRERAVSRRAEMQACVEKRGGTAAAPPEEAPAAESATTTVPMPLTIADPAPPAPAPPAVAITQAPTAPAADPARGRRRAMRITGWTMVGVGVLAAGASAVYAWQAHSIQEDLNAAVNQQPSSTPIKDQRTLEEEGRQDATLARWFGAAAALAGGSGGALLIVSRPTAAPGTGASHAAAALFGWSGTF